MNEARSCGSQPAPGRHLSLDKGNYSRCAVGNERRMHYATMHCSSLFIRLFAEAFSVLLHPIFIPVPAPYSSIHSSSLLPSPQQYTALTISSPFSFSSSPLASRYISFPSSFLISFLLIINFLFFSYAQARSDLMDIQNINTTVSWMFW
jgi:hypothetical protein